MSAKHLTEVEFKELLKKEGIIVADFYAEWCPPCKVMGPIMDGFAEDEDLKDAEIVKIDVDKEPALSAEFKVMSIPTFAILKSDGKGSYEVLETMMGAQDPLNFKTKIESFL